MTDDGDGMTGYSFRKIHARKKLKVEMVARGGIEPPTQGFSVAFFQLATTVYD